MNTKPDEADETGWHQLLASAGPKPALPPGFQAAVWRRIDQASKPEETPVAQGWLEALAAGLLRPRLAFVALSALLILGVALGIMQGADQAKETAKDRYLAAVSPMTVHP